MHATIDPPTATSTTISFVVRHLIPKNYYFYTLNDQAGRQLTEGAVKGTGATRTVEEGIAEALATQPAGTYELRVFEADEFDSEAMVPTADARPDVRSFQFVSAPPEPPAPAQPPQVVRLDRSASTPTTDEVLSVLVLAATNARSFAFYKAFVDTIVCEPRVGSVFGADTYRKLRRATVDFLELVHGPFVENGTALAAYLTANGVLPYVDGIAQRFPDAISGDSCSDLNPDLLSEPFPIELIWSYWHEEGGLVQTLNHILARFQNRRVGPGRDPLARFDLDPLRPAAAHPLGLGRGRGLPAHRAPAGGRVRVRVRAAADRPGRSPTPATWSNGGAEFLEAFHTLLHEALTCSSRRTTTRRCNARRLPGAQRAARDAPRARRGRQQPVRRPAHRRPAPRC